MKEYRLYDFNEINEIIENEGSNEDTENKFIDRKEFIVQMFGIDSEGKRCSIRVESYEQLTENNKKSQPNKIDAPSI